MPWKHYWNIESQLEDLSERISDEELMLLNLISLKSNKEERPFLANFLKAFYHRMK